MITPYWTSKDGRHVLYNADCMDVLPTLTGVDAVVTDPPYGLGMRTVSGGTLKNTQTRFIEGMKRSRWDDSPPSKFLFDRLRATGNAQVIWGGNYFELPPTRCILVWDKMTYIPTMSRVEIAWTSTDGPARYIQINSNNAERVHPTQKPVALMQWCFDFVGGETILDPFTGSGTTGVACIRTGRRFIGCEISREYCDIAVNRMERELSQPKLPGMEPERITQMSLLEAV